MIINPNKKLILYTFLAKNFNFELKFLTITYLKKFFFYLYFISSFKYSFKHINLNSYRLIFLYLNYWYKNILKNLIQNSYYTINLHTNINNQLDNDENIIFSLNSEYFLDSNILLSNRNMIFNYKCLIHYYKISLVI